MTREEILQTAKPILFNTDMVRAILDDRKTVTRRILKLPKYTKEQEDGLYTLFAEGACYENQYLEEIVDYIKPPYKAGDYLYARETWMMQAAKRYDALARIMYRAGGKMMTIYFPNGGTDSISRVDYDAFVSKWRLDRWYPSIHMPKEAARIFLRVTDVRVERLQDMSHNDALKEGIHYLECPDGFTWKNESDMHCCYISSTGAMAALWDSTIPKKDMDKYGWDASPWVWVIEFEKLEVQ